MTMVREYLRRGPREEREKAESSGPPTTSPPPRSLPPPPFVSQVAYAAASSGDENDDDDDDDNDDNDGGSRRFYAPRPRAAPAPRRTPAPEPEPPSASSALTLSREAAAFFARRAATTAAAAAEAGAGASSSSSHPPYLSPREAALLSDPAAAGRIGLYLPSERAHILERFQAKRERRMFQKQVRYGCRKSVADNRVRVNGRFVSAADAAVAILAGAGGPVLFRPAPLLVAAAATPGFHGAGSYPASPARCHSPSAAVAAAAAAAAAAGAAAASLLTVHPSAIRAALEHFDATYGPSSSSSSSLPPSVDPSPTHASGKPPRRPNLARPRLLSTESDFGSTATATVTGTATQSGASSTGRTSPAITGMTMAASGSVFSLPPSLLAGGESRSGRKRTLSATFA
jgi:hypothetical protein